MQVLAPAGWRLPVFRQQVSLAGREKQREATSVAKDLLLVLAPLQRADLEQCLPRQGWIFKIGVLHKHAPYWAAFNTQCAVLCDASRLRGYPEQTAQSVAARLGVGVDKVEVGAGVCVPQADAAVGRAVAQCQQI